MAFTYGFYNSLNGDRKYNATEMSKIFDGMINDGVYSTVGKCFIVKTTEDQNKVIVQSGRAWFDHTWNYLDSDMIFDVEPSNFLLDRIDAIVIDVNSDVEKRENSIMLVQGTPSSTPERPELAKTLEHTQYPLCYIYRKSNVEIIDQANITNTVGTSECPFVTGILEHLTTDELILQWKADWERFIKEYMESATEWMDARKSEYLAWYGEINLQFNEFMKASNNTFDSFMDGTEGTFYAWFEKIRGVLDTDSAGHLQLEIDDIFDTTDYTDKDTIFNDDGSVTDKYPTTGRYEVTRFNDDGSITKVLYTAAGEVVRTLNTTFDDEGNVHYRLGKKKEES